MNEKYFKITNEKENHNGFQYVDGLNILDKPFEETGYCVPGGLYFSHVKHILQFLSYGVHLREVIIPTNDPDFKMVKDPSGDKWRANKLILGEKRNLAERSTWTYLFSLGAAYTYSVSFAWAAKHGLLDIIKLIIEQGGTVTPYEDSMLRIASDKGHLEVVKFLVKNGSRCFMRLYEPIQLASQNGYLEIVKFLIEYGEYGANNEINNKFLMTEAAKNGHLDIVKFFAEEKFGFKVDDCRAMQSACEKGHLDIVKFLFEKGVSKDNNCLYMATINRHNDVVKFLVENCFFDRSSEIHYSIRLALENKNLELAKFLEEKLENYQKDYPEIIA